MHSNEINAINEPKRYTQEVINDENLIDLTSYDYLGITSKQQLYRRAMARVNMFDNDASKSLLGFIGYHQIHKDFEDFLCRQNAFEKAVVVGHDFYLNLSLIETLIKKDDILIFDEKYYESGIVIPKLVDAEVLLFKHNDAKELENILKKSTFKRAVVVVAGIYSINGNLLNKEIFNVVDKYENTLLIVDESHSAGVLGEKLTGVFDFYNIEVKSNYIKMGTLSNTYGSKGAYILASKSMIEYLQNNITTPFYETAPSLIDTELAHQAMLYILKNREKLRNKIKERQDLIKEFFNIEIHGLIFTYAMNNSVDGLSMQEIVRIVLNIDIKIDELKKCFKRV